MSPCPQIVTHYSPACPKPGHEVRMSVPAHLILAKVRVDRAIQRAIETRADSVSIGALVNERAAIRDQINQFRGIRHDAR